MTKEREIYMHGWLGVDGVGKLILPPDMALMTLAMPTPEILALIKSFRSVTYLSGEVRKA